MSNNTAILIIDDNADVLIAAKLFLKRYFDRVDTETNPNRIPFLINNNSYDAILLDMNFSEEVSSGKEGFIWLEKILEIDPKATVVLITAYGDVSMAVKAVKAGATDFVLKPWENEKLLATINTAVRLGQSRKEINELKEKQHALANDIDHPFKDIIGESPEIKEVLDVITRVAQTDASILILGENGTGKEVIARAIHRSSIRSKEVFMNVDLGAIQENLFESELFGHSKGAFTDAKTDKVGRFELANKGTLFLDEIGNLSLPLQAKLLSVLQSRKVTRLGNSREKDVDIRLITATNLPIYDAVEKAEFRQDLLYRINTITINLPPLRNRSGDISILAFHFLKYYNQKYKKKVTDISPDTLRKMEVYDWPGNVRELQHALERAVILCQGTVITENDIYFGNTSAQKTEKLSLDQLNIQDVEKILIQKALKLSHGNISKAASELGITRTSLYRRLEKYGL